MDDVVKVNGELMTGWYENELTDGRVYVLNGRVTTDPDEIARIKARFSDVDDDAD